jgi:hypothetical protein
MATILSRAAGIVLLKRAPALVVMVCDESWAPHSRAV